MDPYSAGVLTSIRGIPEFCFLFSKLWETEKVFMFTLFEKTKISKPQSEN
jgi:hypothetical protein